MANDSGSIESSAQAQLRAQGNTLQYYQDRLRIAQNTIHELNVQINHREALGKDTTAQKARLAELQASRDATRQKYEEFLSSIDVDAASRAAPKRYHTGGGMGDFNPGEGETGIKYSQPGSLTGGGITTPTGGKYGGTLGVGFRTGDQLSSGTYVGGRGEQVIVKQGPRAQTAGELIRALQQGPYTPIASKGSPYANPNMIYGVREGNVLNLGPVTVGANINKIILPNASYDKSPTPAILRYLSSRTERDLNISSSNNSFGMALATSKQNPGDINIYRTTQDFEKANKAIDNLFGIDRTASPFSLSIGQRVKGLGTGLVKIPVFLTELSIVGGSEIGARGYNLYDKGLFGGARQNVLRTRTEVRALPAFTVTQGKDIYSQLQSPAGQSEFVAPFLVDPALRRVPFRFETASIETIGGARNIKTFGFVRGTKNFPIVEYVSDVNAGVKTQSVSFFNPSISEVGGFGYAPRTISLITNAPGLVPKGVAPRIFSFNEAPRLLQFSDLSGAQASPEGALGGTSFLKQFSLTPQEAGRPLAAARLSEILLPEKGLPVKEPFFPLGLAKNPKPVSQLVTSFAAREQGVFFGSVTTQQLPLGFRNVKVGDIDLIFPQRNVAAIQTALPQLVKELNLAGENVRISQQNPLVIETVKGEKFLEAKSGIDQYTLGEELAAAGFYGVKFADLKAGQSPATVRFGEAFAIRAGEQLARKGAASSFFNPPLKSSQLPAEFSEGGIFGRVRANDPRTLKDVAGFIQGGRGLLAIREAENPFLRLYKARSTTKARTQLALFESSFTKEQKALIDQKIFELTGNKVFLDPTAFSTSAKAGSRSTSPSNALAIVGSPAMTGTVLFKNSSTFGKLAPASAFSVSNINQQLRSSFSSPSSNSQSPSTYGSLYSPSLYNSLSQSPTSNSPYPSSTSISRSISPIVSPSLSVSPSSSSSRSISPSTFSSPSPSLSRSTSPYGFTIPKNPTYRPPFEYERRTSKKKGKKKARHVQEPFFYTPTVAGLLFPATRQRDLPKLTSGLRPRAVPYSNRYRSILDLFGGS